MKSYKLLSTFIILLAFIISGSILSVSLWSDKSEKIEINENIIISGEMTLNELKETNNLPDAVIKNVFQLKDKSELSKQVAEYNLNIEDIKVKINKELAIYSEESSKNWVKILIKFVLWIVFLFAVLILTIKRKVSPRLKKILYFLSLTVFGVILSSDPSPMGTVKDAIVLFSSKGVIFPPRMIAFAVFILLVIIANKFICSWGCQIGTLQDLIFRLNRNGDDTKGLIRQFKPSFAFTNTVRILSFIAIIVFAVAWSYDIVEPIDPFKIYKPGVVLPAGWILISAILILSLFIYRPWCHLFCPFGLVGWLFEKLSIYKIKVNYNTCISCGKCSKACPSNVMDAILKQDKVIPDCFSCSTCINVCPTNSISFDKGKREKVPENREYK